MIPRGEAAARSPAASLVGTAALVGLVLFVLLVANGRPIDAGDTRPTERVAASLVHEGDFDLDEYPEVREPFAREAGAHYASIYPVLSAVLAVPVFAAASFAFPLDEQGCALAGKLSAALLSSIAGALMFLVVAKRGSRREAWWTAVLLTLGTSLCSTSQALWQHPAAALFLCLALLFVVKAEEDPAWAGRAGIALALVVAARYADAALVAVLAAGVAVRWKAQIPALLKWSLPPAIFVAAYNWATFGSPLRQGFSGAAGRFTASSIEGHLGLLISPAKGLLVFTPLVLIAVLGMARAWRGGERWLAGTLGAAAAAHWIFMGCWVEWHGGQCFGPRMMTDALPLLFVFLPEGLRQLPRLGATLAAVSVGVQGLGAFAYDGRWEQLYQSPPAPDHRELWAPASSPIPFYLRERVLILGAPRLREGRLALTEYRYVVLGPTGSRVETRDDDFVVSGDEPLLGDVQLLRSARVRDGLLRLRRRGDALFLRVRDPGAGRRLVLVVKGLGHGHLYVGESGRGDKTRWSTYPVDGSFEIVHPYDYSSSGGPDLIVTIGRAVGWADLDSAELLPLVDEVAPEPRP